MRRAFTLVELIVVVIILGILAAVGIPQYRKAMERARGAEAYAALGHIQEAEKVYYATNENYLSSANPLKMTDLEEQKLDMSLPQSGWDVGVNAPVPIGGAAPSFLATATRKSGAGPCGGRKMTVDEGGAIVETGDPLVWWRSCVDAL
jgi:prepilin-type N-terminal cleavage/methylation domain-containing protein